MTPAAIAGALTGLAVFLYMLVDMVRRLRRKGKATDAESLGLRSQRIS